MADFQNDDGEKKGPNATEAMLFFAIVKHTKNKADIDWSKVAEDSNFKNAEVAKVRFGQIKRKYGITTEGGAGTAAPRKSPAKTPAKVKKAPTARAGTKGKKGGKVKKEEDVEENFDDQDMVKEEPEKYRSIFASPSKEEEAAAEAQLQADIDALVNRPMQDHPF